MANNVQPNSHLGAAIGVLVALATLLFYLTNGELGGAKKVDGDGDMPPITSPSTPPR